MVRNADAEPLVNSIRNTFIKLHRAVLGKAPKTRNTLLTIPGTQAKRIEMIYAVGNPKPSDKRLQSDTARHGKNQGIIDCILKNASQPA